MSVNCNGNIVADSRNKLVKILSQGGQLLQKIGRDGSFTFPFHCVQYDKHLIVSDSRGHCISVRSGWEIGMLGEGEFNKPCCLSVNKAGHVMVCDGLNHRVQVFELSGKFMTKFGTKSSGIGVFKKPVSTADLSYGRIVLTDFNNHCIQIRYDIYLPFDVIRRNNVMIHIYLIILLGFCIILRGSFINISDHVNDLARLAILYPIHTN